MVPGWQMESYERLRAAIVKQAVDDYIKALRKSDRLCDICEEQTKLEEWFLSKWGQFLSGDNGEYIIEKCNSSYKPRVHRNGVKTFPDDVQKKICADYKNGMRMVELSRKYGCSITRVQTALRKWGA